MARHRRLAEFGDGPEGELLDQNGDFVDDFETRSLGGFSVGSRASTHTQRTEALYLEATLRRARKEEKATQLPAEMTFQPLTNNSPFIIDSHVRWRLFSSSSSSSSSFRHVPR